MYFFSVCIKHKTDFFSQFFQRVIFYSVDLGVYAYRQHPASFFTDLSYIKDFVHNFTGIIR